MAAPSIAASPEWRTSAQGKRSLIGSERCIGKGDPSATSCDRLGSIAARSPNGSGLTRFPSATPQRQRRVRHVISRNICLAVGRKVACAAGVCFKRSKRAATRAVSQTSNGCWRNGATQNARCRDLRCPLEDAVRRSGDGPVDLADRRRGAMRQAARFADKRSGGDG